MPPTVGLGAIEPLTSSRILLVDDSQVVLSVVRKYLEVHDFKNLQAVSNGAEALALAKVWYPDIILTDIQMPVMDGYELCRQIRAGTEMSNIPILFMTGLTKSEDRNEAFSAGASDLIGKPVDHLELVGRLRVHLDRRRLIKRLSEYHTRMAQELHLAREMQEEILPSAADLKRVQASYPLMLESYYKASIGLGGDLWSLHEIGPNKVLVNLVDFSGHGVGAALNTFRFQAFLNTVALSMTRPSQLLEQANAFLYSHLRRGQFATMFTGLIDFGARTLTYASASAPPMVIGNPHSSDGFNLLDTAGLPLGLLEAGGYEDVSVGFGPGSTLLLYSDALIETPEPPHSIFTPEKLSELLDTADARLLPAKLVEKIVAHLMSNAPRGPGDDLTLVCLHHRIDPSNGEPCEDDK